jgi:hypothetical protein
MSIIGSELLLGAAGAGGYEIERSLRFNSSDSAYLSRTPASAGNRKTWTWAGWVKLSTSTAYIFAASSDNWGGNYTTIQFNGTALRVEGSNPTHDVFTANIFRDYSAWMHLVVAFDTTQATAANRIKVYVNGVEAVYSTASYPAQNSDTLVNAAVYHQISGRPAGNFLNGYLADVHFIDGQALDPSSFGEFDDNGVWQPIAYAGSYGTNGFYLDFADNSTAAALGTDTSGNGHTWTVNNLSVAAGAGNDSLVDSPTNYGTDTGAGGEVRGNYCTWNPLAKLGDIAQTLNVSNGNLQFNSSANIGVLGTLGMASGKWYWEVIGQTLTATGAADQIYVGMTDKTSSTSRIAGLCGYRTTGVITNGNGATTDGSSTTPFVSGDIMRFAYDADAKKLFVGKNGSWLNSGDPVAGTGQAFSNVQGSSLFPVISDNSSPDSVLQTNFGQRPFAYTAPSGFKALCTTNLPEPTIADGSTAMDVALYTGNGSTQTISGLNFSPDFVWIKARSQGTDWHALFNTIVGPTKRLFSNSTAAEATNAQTLTAFNSDGFSVGNTSEVNGSSTTYVAWTWDAGSSTVTNNAGSISSQVRANPGAGFSVVSYTFNSTGTVGHGLGVAPEFVIVKARGLSTQWFVYHKTLGTSKYIRLSFTGPAVNFADGWTPVNSTVFQMEAGLQSTGSTYVAYCFAPVAGYSSFGSYTGNGLADGPFVYTGFRPRWVLVKNSSATGAWILLDSARDTYNVAGLTLTPDASTAESSNDSRWDFLSNGFKIRNTYGNQNNNTETYIYAAFAEHPFQSSRAR